MSDRPMTVWRAAAHADSQALRHFTEAGRPTVKHSPTNLTEALADAEYLHRRTAENQRARNYRTRKKDSPT